MRKVILSILSIRNESEYLTVSNFYRTAGGLSIVRDDNNKIEVVGDFSTILNFVSSLGMRMVCVICIDVQDVKQVTAREQFNQTFKDSLTMISQRLKNS